MSINNKLKVGTVFSGIGAFEQALEKLNINNEIIFACDIDKYVKKSYEANYKCNQWFSDIKEINKNNVKENIDILVGGSPCQSFSVAGKRLGFEDIRGTLFFEYARLIKELQPKVFIYENVKGLLSHDKGKTFETMLNVFNELEYNYYYQVLNASDYLIPQDRKRIFIVGFRSDVKYDFCFPIKKELKLKFKDLLEKSIDQKYYYKDNHGIKNSNLNSLRIRNNTTREYKSGLCPTLTALMGTGGNNVPVLYDGRLRKLTPRECLRLMGFSDNFKQVVSDTQMYKQCGNSIVVNILEEIIKNIRIY